VKDTAGRIDEPLAQAGRALRTAIDRMARGRLVETVSRPEEAEEE